MNQGKQTVADLAFNERDWTRQLPPGYSVDLRMDAVAQKEHVSPYGKTVICSDLQWWLGGHQVPGCFGTALMMVGPEGEVPNVFKR
jgi:hypothetical protein